MGDGVRRKIRESADRIRGLYGIADADASGGDPIRAGVAMLAGGCRLVQLRCKSWAGDDVIRAGRELRLRTREVGALLVANDDVDVALAIDADGLHLGQTDGPTGDARRRLGDRLLGRSTNTPEQLRAALAEDADYLAFGPMYPTGNLSRPKALQGPALLATLRAEVDRPLVAIGGITVERLPEIRATGADSWAVIGAICGAADPVAATRALLG